VLCAAFCTGQSPLVSWVTLKSKAAADVLELSLKSARGEPPLPVGDFGPCRRGAVLRKQLLDAAGAETFEAGYISATFDIGEQLSRIFAPRFDSIWRSVRRPPGPWIAS
jgi:hypothetical protein